MMKNTLLTIAIAVGSFSLNSCIGAALWGADKGSEAMEEADNSAVRQTGETIQKGLAPINRAKDNAVDAVKDAVD